MKDEEGTISIIDLVWEVIIGYYFLPLTGTLYLDEFHCFLPKHNETRFLLLVKRRHPFHSTCSFCHEFAEIEVDLRSIEDVLNVIDEGEGI